MGKVEYSLFLKLDELAVGYKSLPQREARIKAICLREKVDSASELM